MMKRQEEHIWARILKFNKVYMFQTISLLLLISLGYFSTDIYLPSLPAIGEDFGALDSTVQLTMFAYMISFASTPLIFGPLSDQIGRKKVILIGLIILLLGTFGCYLSPSIYWLIAFRFFQGVGGGAIIISSRAMIPDLYEGVGLAKKMTQITMFMPLALAMGPLFGGYLQEHQGWRSVFLFLGVYIFLLLLKMRFIDESLKMFSEKKSGSVLKNYRELISNRQFVFAILGLVFPAVGLFAYLSVSSFLFQEILGLSPFEYGFLSIFIGGAVMASSYLNHKMLGRYPTDSLIKIGVGIMSLSGFLLLCFHFVGWMTPFSVLLPILIYFSCLPLCISNSIAKAMTMIDHAYGAAGALMTSTQFFAGSLGILIFSRLKVDSVLPLAICFLVMSVLTGTSLKFSGASLKESSDNH